MLSGLPWGGNHVVSTDPTFTEPPVPAPRNAAATVGVLQGEPPVPPPSDIAAQPSAQVITPPVPPGGGTPNRARKATKGRLIALAVVVLLLYGPVSTYFGSPADSVVESAEAEVSVLTPTPVVEPAFEASVETTSVEATCVEVESNKSGLIPATVVGVVDGDTADFMVEGVEERVRFIGVDTPESTNQTEPYGKEASARTASILTVGREVYLETDAELRDRYGRLLAYVWLSNPTARDGRTIRAYMLNAQLACDGYAQQMTIQPNSKYADYFTAFVEEARNEERGLWASVAPAAPVPAVAPTTKATTVVKTAVESASVVYRTKTGSKYHADGCRYLSNSQIEMTLKAAKSMGLAPCSVCSP